MSDHSPVMLPAYPYDEEKEESVFSSFDPGTRVLDAGYHCRPQYRPIPVDIVFEKDVAVRLRDGTTIYVDVLRPAGSENVPVLIAWSPYGKSTGNAPKYDQLFGLLGIDVSQQSGLQKFEGPDPAYWCANGYAICHPDPRGVFNSEGDSTMMGEQEGRDCADLIEWLAEQEWCNGKVGMSGTSYLAISQWFTAAEQPPHLAAIAPTEGMSDVYRDLVFRGGMPDLEFPGLLALNFVGKGQREDLVAEAERYPLFNELWETKAARLADITVPAYVVASYTNGIHTPGTFRGWREMNSMDKWLRIHNTMEWPDYYSKDAVEDLRRFFDRYLKGEDNGWDSTPRVRYSVLDLHGNDRVDVPAENFPPEDFAHTNFYLDGQAAGLTTKAPRTSTSVSYDPTDDNSRATFDLTFDEDVDVVGYPRLRLWVEADGADDMDVFVLLEKLDANGDRLEQFNVPNDGPAMQAITANGASILKYKGSNGRLRVSLRALDDAKSTDDVPVHAFNRQEKLEPGEVVPIDIDLFPVGLSFHAGEVLRLVVSGQNLLGGVMPRLGTVVPENSGRHIVHAGGEHESYLRVPTRSTASRTSG